jgi:hypothetical protein
MGEMQGYVIEYLAKALAFLKDAPEEASGTHFYLDKIAVVCEGDTIGHLHNEDPDWVFRPTKENT